MLNARLLLPAVLLVVGLGAAQRDRTTGDGVYIAAQADSGALLFEQMCQNCHLPNWEKQTGLYAKWRGKSLTALATYLWFEMPQTGPGTLTREEYATVNAYLLRLIGNPPGDTPLNANPDALADIRIDTLRSGR
jgi:mono/diheme cytochrome c family protein